MKERDAYDELLLRIVLYSQKQHFFSRLRSNCAVFACCACGFVYLAYDGRNDEAVAIRHQVERALAVTREYLRCTVLFTKLFFNYKYMLMGDSAVPKCVCMWLLGEID